MNNTRKGLRTRCNGCNKAIKPPRMYCDKQCYYLDMGKRQIVADRLKKGLEYGNIIL